MKEQEKTTGKKKKKTEINDWPDKEFRAFDLRMLSELGKRLYEHSENFYKELKKIQSEMSNSWKLKQNMLEFMNSTLSYTEEYKSGMEDRIMEITHLE